MIIITTLSLISAKAPCHIHLVFVCALRLLPQRTELAIEWIRIPCPWYLLRWRRLNINKLGDCFCALYVLNVGLYSFYFCFCCCCCWSLIRLASAIQLFLCECCPDDGEGVFQHVGFSVVSLFALMESIVCQWQRKKLLGNMWQLSKEREGERGGSQSGVIQ